MEERIHQEGGDGVPSGRGGFPSTRIADLSVAFAFAILAGWFLFGPDRVDLPLSGTPPFDRADLDGTPRRERLTDPPRVVVNGFERTCMDCHRTFPPPAQDPPVPLRQHADVALDHGPHRQCRSCHHPQDRDYLLAADGSTLSFSDSRALCGRCHVSILDDWSAGMHGRTNGYWDATRGEVERLDCVSCHDPHAPSHPAMDPLTPLPGPHTLRMSPVQFGAADEAHESKVDPLRRPTTTPKESR